MISLPNDISQSDEIALRNIRSELLSYEKFSCLPATCKLSDLNLRGESYLKYLSEWKEKHQRGAKRPEIKEDRQGLLRLRRITKQITTEYFGQVFNRPS